MTGCTFERGENCNYSAAICACISPLNTSKNMEQSTCIWIKIDKSDIPILVFNHPSSVYESLVNRARPILKCRGFFLITIHSFIIGEFPTSKEVTNFLNDLCSSWSFGRKRKCFLVKIQQKIGIKPSRRRCQWLKQIGR